MPMNADMPTSGPPGLDRLHDIVVPAVISWWPLSTAAWLVVAVACLWVGIGALHWWRAYRRNAYRRAALRHLEAIRVQLHAGETPAAALNRVAELLKRTALGAFPRQDVALLSGEPWLCFLARTAGAQELSGAPGQTLIAATFNPKASLASPTDCEHILNLARAWITNHRAATAPASPGATKPSNPRRARC
jgi:hypothetical protein